MGSRRLRVPDRHDRSRHPSTIARAVLKVSRLQYATFSTALRRHTAGNPPRHLGRLSAIDVLNEIKADVTGLETFVADESETGARGAAMLAATALRGSG